MLHVFVLLSGMWNTAAFNFHECRIQTTYFGVIIRWNDWLFGQTLSYCCCLFLSSLTLDRFILVLCIAFDFLSFSFFLPLLGVKYAVFCVILFVCNFAYGLIAVVAYGSLKLHTWLIERKNTAKNAG